MRRIVAVWTKANACKPTRIRPRVAAVRCPNVIAVSSSTRVGNLVSYLSQNWSSHFAQFSTSISHDPDTSSIPLNLGLKELSVHVLRTENWSAAEASIARNLLDQWLEQCTKDVNTARFATLLIKRILLCDKKVEMNLFYRVLHLWQRAEGIDPQKAVNLLHVFYATNTQSLMPDARAYSMIFETLAKEPAAARTVPVADELIRQLHRSQDGNLSNVLVAQNSYLNLLAKCSPYLFEAPEKAEAFLKRMTRRDERSYGTVLHAWTKSGRRDAADRSFALLELILGKQKIVDRVCFNSCLQALGNAGRGQQAEDLLWRMQSIHKKTENLSTRPDAYSFLAVIHGWAKEGNPARAIAILENMISMQTENPELKPTVHIYSSIMDAWAKKTNSGSDVEAILVRMEKEYARTNDEAMRPSRKTYGIAIHAWSKTDSPYAPDRATELVHQMDVLSRNGRADLAPCNLTYSALLRIWTWSSRKDGPTRGLAVLRHMEGKSREASSDFPVPSIEAYNSVLGAFARHGMAHEAHNMLEALKSNLRGKDAAIRVVEPNATSYCNVISAFARSRLADSGVISQRLMCELERVYDATGEQALAPTPRVYIRVIKAQRDPEDAEAVLWHMKDRLDKAQEESTLILASPTTAICNEVLQAWAISGDPIAPARVEDILQWMEQQNKTSRTSSLAPDSNSFQYIFQAWERSERRNTSDHIRRIKSKIQSQYPHLLQNMRR